MPLSDRFLNLVQQQLSSFEGESTVARLVVYVASGQGSGAPSLMALHQWPDAGTSLPAVESDPALRAPAAERRWYPLRDGSLLLGALRAERHPADDWQPRIDRRLQACAAALAQCLSLDLEQSRLRDQLDQQRQHLNLMVHQLRNPLAALRTYAQLLLRRLGPDSDHRPLVENLLEEQAQLDRYIATLDRIGQSDRQLEASGSTPLLLPPMLPSSESITLRDLLTPLAERAAATAALQARHWQSPGPWPEWSQRPRPREDGVVAEIIANLLENAFRYSPAGTPLGLHLSDQGLCVWDGGTAIASEERERIFAKGFRGSTSAERSGSGLGLALARQLAEERGGRLELICPPNRVDPTLPEEGNAFLLTLPLKSGVEAESPEGPA